MAERSPGHGSDTGCSTYPQTAVARQALPLSDSGLRAKLPCTARHRGSRLVGLARQAPVRDSPLLGAYGSSLICAGAPGV